VAAQVLLLEGAATQTPNATLIQLKDIWSALIEGVLWWMMVVSRKRRWSFFSFGAGPVEAAEQPRRKQSKS
jgi:hypothetical protein